MYGLLFSFILEVLSFLDQDIYCLQKIFEFKLVFCDILNPKPNSGYDTKWAILKVVGFKCSLRFCIKGHYYCLWQDGCVNVFYSTPSMYVDAINVANEAWPLKTCDFSCKAFKNKSYSWAWIFLSVDFFFQLDVLPPLMLFFFFWWASLKMVESYVMM
jgi:hypothetical protein